MYESTEGTTEVPIVKAHFIGRDGSETSNVVETPARVTKLFSEAHSIPPPLDPTVLCSLYDMSGALRTNIDAYKTNIDGFGHSFTPVLDVDDDETFDKVKSAIEEERFYEVHAGLDEQAQAEVDVDSMVNEVTDAEVEARLEVLQRQIIRERMRAESFFDFCCVDESFTSLRKRTRQDIEATGNGYWEVLRNAAGDIVQFVYVPSFTVRLMPQETAHTEVTMAVRRTVLRVEEQTVRRRFRRYVQVFHGDKVVWFKEFGDPRLYSASTGKMYKNDAALRKHEGSEARAATEILHFRIPSPKSPYGVPRWVPELTSVLGTRNAQEVNLFYFENNSVPPMAVLVSGGRLGKDSTDALKAQIEAQVKGKRNFHKVWILQAEPASTAGPQNNGNVKIELRPLMDAQQSDAQHLKYIEKNDDMIGSVFRMPRLLRGDAKDFNRSTAETSLEFAEQQVFEPERRDFDFTMNRKIMPELGVKFWLMKSRGPEFSDALAKIKAVNETAQSGYLIPSELRGLAGEAFGKDFTRIEDAWVKQPLQFTMAGIDVSDEFEFEETELTPEAPNNAPPRQTPRRPADDEEVEQADLLRIPEMNTRPRSKMDRIAMQAQRLIAIRDTMANLSARAAKAEHRRVHAEANRVEEAVGT